MCQEKSQAHAPGFVTRTGLGEEREVTSAGLGSLVDYDDSRVVDIEDNRSIANRGIRGGDGLKRDTFASVSKDATVRNLVDTELHGREANRSKGLLEESEHVLSP